MKFTAASLLILAMIVGAYAQRPRVIDTNTEKTDAAKPAPAPHTVNAKYEGGVFGYNKSMDGTLSFDDTNNRLLFRNKQQKEVFFIPYVAVSSAFADTKKRQPTAASVASAVPLIYALPARFIKTKVRYLTLQYSDPDTKMAGITSFRLENRDILASVLRSVAEKSGLTARGEIYVRKKDDEAKKNP